MNLDLLLMILWEFATSGVIDIIDVYITSFIQFVHGNVQILLQIGIDIVCPWISGKIDGTSGSMTTWY